MEQKLPFFNWSVKKALSAGYDSFTNARVRIVYALLLFTLLKLGITVDIAWNNEQWRQVVRAVVALFIYISLLKVLLYRPGKFKQVGHIMIVIGLLFVWSNIFVYSHRVNMVTLQFVFMVMMSSFYVLGSRLGIFYSTLGILPLLITIITKGNTGVFIGIGPQELAYPGPEIITALNFISIVVSHYLFFEAFMGNVQEKERLNVELQSAIVEAQQLAASKSAFLSTMSHELRTPLNSVVGLTEILLRDGPEERHKQHLNVLQSSAHDLLSLINNVLDFNKLDSDKMVLERVPFSISEFMHNICAVLRIKASSKRLDLVLDIDEQLADTVVFSDPTRLSQVMYNLVGNAIKFTDNGLVTVELRVSRRTGDDVAISFAVRDTGIGISQEKHDTIFEVFSHAESYTSRKYGGTGLGLPIVKKVLGLLGSDIELESSPGKGANFFFTIAFATAPSILTATGGRSVTQTDLSKLRIMVVEDNGVNRMIIKRQLSMLQIDAVMAQNGREAYEIYLSGDFDVILMDLHMPVLNGYETIKLIRALPDQGKANVRVVAFTASVIEPEALADASFDDFLFKPVNVDALRDILTKLTDLSPAIVRQTDDGNRSSHCSTVAV